MMARTGSGIEGIYTDQNSADQRILQNSLVKEDIPVQTFILIPIGHGEENSASMALLKSETLKRR